MHTGDQETSTTPARDTVSPRAKDFTELVRFVEEMLKKKGMKLDNKGDLNRRKRARTQRKAEEVHTARGEDYTARGRER
ncbi:unnamed protein product [Alternaria alternata]